MTAAAARRRLCCALLCTWLFAPASTCRADETHPATANRSLSNTQFEWPSAEHVVRVLSLRDYNTRVVLLGTTLLGVCAGAVGTLMLLRKRALAGDVVGHASLPGIGIAFLTLEMFHPGGGRSLVGLLIGAGIAGLAGILCTTAVRRFTRIKEDAALAIVLSIFFGLGIVLFTIIQNMPTGNAAGLHQFIFGKAASMVARDVLLISRAAVFILLAVVLLFKELSLLCFDENYAAAQGWPVVKLDLLLMALVVAVTVIGLQSVGLLLVVALLITPAAAARFWTERFSWMAVGSAVLGGTSALLGVLASALFPRLAAGAIIVLAGTAMFIFSLFCGRQRGILPRWLMQRRARQRIGRHDLLRASYEVLEARAEVPAAGASSAVFTRAELLSKRSWSPRRLSRLLDAARREGSLETVSGHEFRLTAQGVPAARRAVRNHRLWELYLIQYADIAPSHVDRDADEIEHVLSPELIDELEQILGRRYPALVQPASPHELPAGAAS